MVKPRNKITEENDDITINLKKSSVAEFTKRPVPSREEVEEFKEIIEDSVDHDDFTDTNDEMEEEIEESLNEIYHDEKGRMVDVRKMDIKKKRGFLFWTMAFLMTTSIGATIGFAAYVYYYLPQGTDATAFEFTVEGETEVVAGEEFFYTINYRNLNNIVISNARIEVQYPDNFIYIDSFPEATGENSNIWEIASIPARLSNSIKVKGMMVAQEGDTGVIVSNITYTPANFSSEFKKESTLTTVVRDIGIEFDFDLINTALVGEDHDILVHITNKEYNYINNFRVTLEPQENIEILSHDGADIDNTVTYTSDLPGVWQVEEISDSDKVLPVKIKFLDKTKEKQEVVFKMEKAGEGGEYRLFHEERLNFEVLKSDLNLALIINGQRDDQGVEFGETLNYSIVYNNKGETELKDVIIMVVLESDFLDGTSLIDSLNGREKGNTISWTKEELPELEVIEVNEEGTIDFSIDVVGTAKIDPKAVYQVKSFAQFGVGEIGEGEEISDDNRSNTIINKINSDLKIKETVRYFSEDNIPVGTGPHPPQVGEATSYKVYWQIENNLHELNDLNVSVILPDYVSWDDKARATVGDVSYNNSLNAIIWEIGRLPITVFEASAEFSVSVTPTEDDRNKIMVLMPGSKVTAIDAETEAELKKETKAQTTKLEDDEIGRGDGIVE